MVKYTIKKGISMSESGRATREREFWDDESQRYHDAQQDFVHVIDEFVRRALAIMPANSRVIEFGCGSGIVTLELARHVEHISGVDISEKMLAIARQSAEDAGCTNADFRLGDVYDMPEGDGSYDVVLCPYLLDIVERPDVVLREAYRLLTDSGVLICITDCKQVPEEFTLPRRIVREISKSIRDVGRRLGFITSPMRAPRDTELLRLTKQAGFRMLETAIIDLQTDDGIWLNLFAAARKF